ncbi:MAG TPA: LysE family translocator [Paracoccus solventivorans]|uniref:LysE family translocator n=1 Tax=Paracoccus solventivorans TaxID=53463 RepID=A0A832PNK4_9RHOB|nr:LysE family translocator [Paracoccus solventivorans]HHW34774.1 LysE family translocator [Paracoccus solventivorans]
MSFETWLLFLLTSAGIALTPGPNVLLALTHGALHGNRRALWTIMGGVTGLVAVMGLCMFGIGALVRTSALWLTGLKLVGGAYLVWLGIRLWASPPIVVAAAGGAAAVRGAALFRSGFLTAATNPKGLLFFSALLPQFLSAERSLAGQFLVMGATYAVIEFAVEYLYAAAAHRVRPWLARVGRRFNRVCGGIFVAIGAALPLR